MENASKALIIAGAILIAILLISMGVGMITSTSSVTDASSAELGSMAIKTFNGQFTTYEGTGKSASDVKSLVSAVNASNAKNQHTVGVHFDSTVKKAGTTAIVQSVAELQMQKKYTIELIYATVDGTIPSSGVTGGKVIVNGESTASDMVAGQVAWIVVKQQ